MRRALSQSELFSRVTACLRLVWWVALFTLAANAHGAAEGNAPDFGPPSSWVKPQFFDRDALASSMDFVADERLLLLEKQINVPQDETFIHSIRQILTTAGVQKDSTITIDFNPGYQNLTMHWARIWRGGSHLERLDTNSVKVVQPEREMEDYIMNGRKSAILVLDDVRVGDIIDYSYSVKGANPVFGNRFSANVPVQLEQPAGRLLTRVIWPKQRHLFAKAINCSIQPTVAITTNTMEYTWDVHPAPGLDLEDFLPMWCNPGSWVELSEFKTWAEVNQWAFALFQVPTPLSPELTQKIEEFKRIPGREQQILAALRFVQDEVRYFGIEIGPGTEKPTDPSTVFSRRFGDCKDKSLLFVAILRSLGFQAYPVLVDSTHGRAVDQLQPSPGAFDHCIAVVQFSGQAYWLDPTINYQRGPLSAHYLPPYERGLVVAPATTTLSIIPQTTGTPMTSVSEYFELRGKNEPAGLRVVTIADGRDADLLRELFATTKRSDIEKQYTHYYSDLYPGVKMAGSVTTSDDEDQDRFQTSEIYSIDNAWVQADATTKPHFDLYPYSISAMLKKPVDVSRRMPLGIGFPEHQFVHTEVTLPSAWPAAANQQTVFDPAFSFQKAYRCSGNKLLIEYDYRALADSVPPDRVSEYLQRLNQSSQLLGYSLSWK